MVINNMNGKNSRRQRYTIKCVLEIDDLKKLKYIVLTHFKINKITNK